MIHRDLKLENILLSEDRQVAKLADFGLVAYTRRQHKQQVVAATRAHSTENAPLTPAGTVHPLADTTSECVCDEGFPSPYASCYAAAPLRSASSARRVVRLPYLVTHTRGCTSVGAGCAGAPSATPSTRAP